MLEEMLQHTRNDEETAIILARAWDAKVIMTSPYMLELCAEFGINPKMVERLIRRPINL